MTAKKTIWSSSIYLGNDNTSQTTAVVNLFKDLHDKLLLVGATQTTDTGQIDSFDSIQLVNGAMSYYFGYRMYELNDKYHSNSPIFLKITFSTITTTSYTGRVQFPRLSFQIGSGSNGSGSLETPSDALFNTLTTAAMTYANSVYRSGAQTSYMYNGDGVFWFALNCGGIAPTPSNEIKPNFIGKGGVLACIIISRPCDSAGDILLGKAAIMSVAYTESFSSSSISLKYYAPLCSYVNLETGGSYKTSYPLARPLSDIQINVDGAAPIARVYGFFGSGGLVGLSGVASIPAVYSSDGTTTITSIYGIKESEYITPHSGIKGFIEIPSTTDYRNQDNSPFFDTPLLSWDGELV